jgi:hypothetical protein
MFSENLYKIKFTVEFRYLIKDYGLKCVYYFNNWIIGNLQTYFDFIKQLLAKLLCEHVTAPTHIGLSRVKLTRLTT